MVFTGLLITWFGYCLVSGSAIYFYYLLIELGYVQNYICFKLSPSLVSPKRTKQGIQLFET